MESMGEGRKEGRKRRKRTEKGEEKGGGKRLHGIQGEGKKRRRRG